jgi:RNA-directed DNA polymerase
MSGSRQNNRQQPNWASTGWGEASVVGDSGAEPSIAVMEPESPATTMHLMEEVCERENLVRAWQRVRGNKGAPGIDGMTIEDAKSYLREHWPDIRSQLLSGTYRPQPVRRVEIPKPDGGVRKLGVPRVVDRLIQQALLQVLQKRWDPTFSEHSYGFRPQRSAHQAVAQAQAYVAEGYSVVVDLDLEKFFDLVNHDILMARVAARVADKRVLKLVRAFLTAGVLEDGLVRPVDEGTPQGGPLSPLLSNLLLDDLDKELERRGLRFCRYADDCNIYVRSRRAGGRVMVSVSQFLTRKLKLKVNETKSAVARPEERKFLGFSISNDGSERRIAPKALAKFKMRVRELTRRTRGLSLRQLVDQLRPYLIGWRRYFGFCQTPIVLRNLEAWIRRRLRMYLWRQWKGGYNRFKELRRRGVKEFQAAVAAGSPTGFWRMSRHVTVQQALRNHEFEALGLPRLNAAR